MLKIPVVKMVDGEQVAFPLPACEEVTVRLCSAFRRVDMKYSVDVERDNVLEVKVDGTLLSIGRYGLEVSGRLLGCAWRSAEYPQIEIVNNNADSDVEFVEDAGDNSVDIDTMLVVLPPTVELQQLIDGANEAMEKAKETDAKITERENGRQDSEAQRDISEAKREESEKERITNEEQRQIDEGQRKKDMQQMQTDVGEAIEACEQAVVDARVSIEYDADEYGIIITTGETKGE